MIAVSYPSALRMKAMLFSVGRRGIPLLATPLRSGYRPVIRADLAGAHIGAFEYQLRQTVPPAARPAAVAAIRTSVTSC